MEPTRPHRSREHGIVLVLACAAPLALVVLGLALRPDPRGYGTHEQLGFQPCLPMALWHVPCPGCGVTTAVTLAVQGSPLASLRTQPLGPILLVLAFVAAVLALRGHRRGIDLYRAFEDLPWKRIGVRLLALVVLCWAYKLALVRGWL